MTRRGSTMGLVPRFRSSWYIAATTDTNFASKRGTSKHMVRVPLFDLKFLTEFCGKRCRSFKSAALVAGAAVMIAATLGVANAAAQPQPKGPANALQGFSANKDK